MGELLSIDRFVIAVWHVPKGNFFRAGKRLGEGAT